LILQGRRSFIVSVLEGLSIERPNQVGSSDLTYLPMAHGFASERANRFMLSPRSIEVSKAGSLRRPSQAIYCQEMRSFKGNDRLIPELVLRFPSRYFSVKNIQDVALNQCDVTGVNSPTG
jgi:hypothetical protein